MIHETYASTRPLPPIKSHGETIGGRYITAWQRAQQLKITEDEFHRRNAIVKGLYAKCQYRTGFAYMPESDEKAKEYGVCTVKGIFRSYFEFPLAEPWPDDDHPLIVSFTSEAIDGLVLCVEDWLSPVPVNTTCV